jgi:uncharacterized protein DUF5753
VRTRDSLCLNAGLARLGGASYESGIVPLSGARRSTYFDDASDTATLLRVFERLEELAADPRESVRLIRQIDKER